MFCESLPSSSTPLLSPFSPLPTQGLLSVYPRGQGGGGSGSFSESCIDPDPGTWLQSGGIIRLDEAPDSNGARALTDHVAALMLPELLRVRPVGPKAMPGFIADTGAILRGLLRGAYRDSPVSAQRREGGSMWPFSLIGNKAFWAKIDALERLDLSWCVKGVQTNDGAVYGGFPARLGATRALLDLAESYGVEAATQGTDWRVSPLAESKRFEVPVMSLVVMREARETGRVNATAANVGTEQAELLEQMRGRVEALNACVARADIRGCRLPVFRRNFVDGDLRLHGRHYAVGADSYQTMNKATRSAITIDGEPVVEIDIASSFLTIFLALTGTRVLPEGDLYAVGNLPRETVKAWMSQSFATGRHIKGWSSRGKGRPLEKPSAVAKAVLAAYPAFGEPLTNILPDDLRAALEPELHGKAVGHFLTFMESQVVSVVMANLISQGHPVLPMHDGLIVGAQAAGLALEEVRHAFVDLLGVVPLVR